MKGFYLTISLLSLAGVMSANAMDYQAPQVTTAADIPAAPVAASVSQKSEVPEYDVLNKSDLGNRRGFVAMNMGGELTRDSAGRYGHTFLNEPQNGNILNPSYHAAEGMQGIEPAAGQPAAPVPVLPPQTISYVWPGAPAGTAMQTFAPQQEVVTTYYIVGNTDTGVNMDEVQRLMK